MPKKRDPRLSLEQSRRLSRARMLGQGSGRAVYLEDHSLARIIAIIERDVARRPILKKMPALARTQESFFGMDITEFDISFNVDDLNGLYIEASEKIVEFETMFDCLCELHKRRSKVRNIKSTQPIPDISQIAPRSLLEYGDIPDRALASLMVWRKFQFDLDNRIAQETGYLFEPIVARALGGEPFDARTSPVRRVEDPNRGRQVDCIEDRHAYEIKIRLSDAASGRGRLNEEMSFPADCAESGYIPILLGFESDNSQKVRDLVANYEHHGGHAYIGQDAWDYLRDAAGETMMNFIEEYLLQIIDSVIQSHNPEDLMDVTYRLREGRIETVVTSETGEEVLSTIIRPEA